MTDYGKRGRRKCLHHNGNYFCNLKNEKCRGVCDDFEFKSTKMTVRKKLIDFWNREIGDEMKAGRAAKSLQRQAEIDVAEAHEKFESAEGDFEKAKMDAKDDPKEGFKKIVEKHKKMLIEKKKFEDTVDMYESLFEEKPRLLE